MFQSLCAKLSALCVFAALTGSVAAQTGSPFAPPAPFGQPNAFTNEVLEQMFRKMDPNVQVQDLGNGTRRFLLVVTRSNGVQLPMVVDASSTQLTVCIRVKDAFVPAKSMEEINRGLEEASRLLAPVKVTAHPVEGYKVAFVATRLIDRTISDQEFAIVWNGFLKTATDIRTTVNQ